MVGPVVCEGSVVRVIDAARPLVPSYPIFVTLPDGSVMLVSRPLAS